MSAAAFWIATILWVAEAGPLGATTPAPPDEPPVAKAPAEPKPLGNDPALGTLRLRMGLKRLIYLYSPKVPQDPNTLAVIYFSGDWGWRPLQQETAAHLAGKGRYVVGLDAAEYFDQKLEPADWAADLATLRSYANEKAGRPKDTPVLLMGFAFAGELVPYVLNRGGTKGFAGALLMSLDQEGAVVYSTSIQLKMPLPPDQVFSVAEEIRRLPPSFPVYLMDGSLDAASAMTQFAGLLRGPHLTATIDGADRSFRKNREAHFTKVDEALLWLESQGSRRVPPN